MFQPNSKFGRRVEYVCTVNYHFERHCCLFLHLWSCSSYFFWFYSLLACRLFWLRLHSLVLWGIAATSVRGKVPQPHRVIAANQRFAQKSLFLTSCAPVISWPHNLTLFDHNRKRVEISQINEIEKLVQGGWVPGAGPVQPVVDPELHPASIAASTA